MMRMATVKDDDQQMTRGPGRPRNEGCRRRILDSAAHLLETVGFTSATMQAIAERAGASKATIYRWWPNKAAVLIEAFREAVADDLPFTVTGSLEEDIRRQLRQFGKMLTSSRGRAFAAFVAGAQSDPEVAEAFRAMWIAPRRAGAKQSLQRYCESGELPRDLDLDLAIEILYAPLYYRLLTGYGTITPRYVNALTRTILDGLRALKDGKRQDTVSHRRARTEGPSGAAQPHVLKCGHGQGAGAGDSSPSVHQLD
jgi:AcrR family transcriptional regulator